ncbi:MAG: MmgE/PrpD family protein [Alphaproteobacteria bacterium]|nr:MmgE/PrpD family protein [Alphaproteobacteria bacterium]
MVQETVRLAQYAAALRYEDLPSEIVTRAKECIADTVAAIICGAGLPWSRIVIAYAECTGPGGKCHILGAGRPSVTAPAAALSNGALAHAFELDSLTRPGAGVHPGATLLPPALALAQQQGLGGRALIAAFVAGCEVMVRIGRATGHTNEQRGFHAPGNTGPFGGAIASGHLLRLDAERMAMALGIAGSLACGLLEFARAGRGGMVKRLHLGRASEGGVLAASLAQDGFTAPDTVLEGPFGFLAVFCREWDVAELTKGLGEHWETSSIALKRYPCHINAHAAVKAITQLQADYGFAGADVEDLAITGSERMATLHNIPEPADLMMAQYSVPFCAALAVYRDPRNPESFAEGALDDPDIRALCRRVTVEAVSNTTGHGAGATTVTIDLKGDQRLAARIEDGTLAPTDLEDKFLRLTRGALGEGRAAILFERLQHLEDEPTLDWLGGEI